MSSVLYDYDSVQRQKIVERAVRQLLCVIDDPEREGLKETPARVARMIEELRIKGKDFKATCFQNDGVDQMIVVRAIPFFSFCEHHLLPFFGTVTIGYVPQERLIGLSKLARAVDRFACRLQLQERLTEQIANFVEEITDPIGVGVVVKAQHLCMAMRGIQKPGHETITSAMRGVMLDKPGARAELLSLMD